MTGLRLRKADSPGLIFRIVREPVAAGLVVGPAVELSRAEDTASQRGAVGKRRHVTFSHELSKGQEPISVVEVFGEIYDTARTWNFLLAHQCQA